METQNALMYLILAQVPVEDADDETVTEPQVELEDLL